MSYDNPWIWNDKPFEDQMINNNFGFVYLIENLKTGRMYVGRKYFRKKVGKKTTPSNWKIYYGSCDELNDDIKVLGAENFKRTILSLHATRGAVNYGEVEEQINRRVIFNEDYYNGSINGKYYNVRLDKSEFSEKSFQYDFHNDEWKAKHSEFMKSRCWITNGTETKLIPKNEEIPEGWRKGNHLKGKKKAHHGITMKALWRDGKIKRAVGKSGHKNITIRKKKDKTYYVVRKTIDGKRVELGNCLTLEDALKKLVAGVGFEPTTFAL